MSERRDDRASEAPSSDAGIESPPVLPPDSPGSSVSAQLQKEYDELLKYAVVVPEYNLKDTCGKLAETRGAIGKQEDIITIRASPRQAGFLRDLDRAAQRDDGEDGEGETTPRRREDHSGVKDLPDFGESSIDSHGPRGFTLHLRADPSEEEKGRHPYTEPMFPNAPRNTGAGGSHSRGASPLASDPLFRSNDLPVETVYTATVDQDVGKMEGLLDHWCLELKRNVLAEFSQAKVVIEQKSRQELMRETTRHSQEKEALIEELDGLKEFLHTFKQSMERKDVIISNLTQAVFRQRDKMQLMRNFCQWKVHHNDAKREAFTLKMAKCHNERTLKRRVLTAWFSLVHNKWRQRVEKACQNKAQEICVQISSEYEAKIASLNEAKKSSCEEVRRLHVQRDNYEEAMKKAFMRGVCALNMEAMSMFHGEENNSASTPQYGGREERAEDFSDSNLDYLLPDKGPPSAKAIPHDAAHPSASVDLPPPRVVTSQGSRSVPASSAPPRQTSAKPSSITTAAHKMCVVKSKVPLKASDAGRPAARSLSPSVHPPVASVIVERHQPVTKQTIGQATAAKYTTRTSTETDKFRKLAGQQGTLAKPPPIQTIRVD